MLFFRDYLKSHEQARKQYEEIKSTYVKKTATCIKQYTEFKEAFVKSIFKMSHH
ncbi:GrpB family protein [Alkalihalobacillus pseudalcaliphilus]|uniref:GrpB family protein n=1 Tax=Alkalihalobacillus pseudalcaliphilus TaxID=79884 RepID=UPI0023621926|nr:GrpB family protein [Alkalihalobacillus pseudalcaliphilus]